MHIPSKVESCFQIFDLEGVNMINFVKIIKVIADKVGIFFPSNLNQAIVINVPQSIEIFVKLVKSFLHPVTAEKVEVIRNREIWQKVILDYVPK